MVNLPEGFHVSYFCKIDTAVLGRRSFQKHERPKASGSCEQTIEREVPRLRSVASLQRWHSVSAAREEGAFGGSRSGSRMACRSPRAFFISRDLAYYSCRNT